MAIQPASQKSERVPRRIVVLTGDRDSEAEQVLATYEGNAVSGRRLHRELQQYAAAHPGKCVAGEWLGKLGWTRFVWCRK